MLTNAISMLIYIARPLLVHPDAPILFRHATSDGLWQIVVSRAPHAEAIAA